MRYTIHLFGLDAPAFNLRLRSQGGEVIERTRARLTREGNLDPETLNYGLQLAGKICRGDLPEICSVDYFWALCWLADTELERISLNVFVRFRGFDYVKAVGLWPLLDTWPPPFPKPQSDNIPPTVGYLPREQIVTSAIPALEQLPSLEEYIRSARQQFVEVLESLAEDKLDLLAVII